MKSNFFDNKNILVTGGSGMIGRQLISILQSYNANLTVADLFDNNFLNNDINFIKTDLRDYDQCKSICKNKDIVFNLVGVKASPKACLEKPASIMGPMLQFNTNMIEAAIFNNIEWFLYTSSIGVYQPDSILKVENYNGTNPSKNDWYGGWAKRMGEMLIEAHQKEKNIKLASIVRPANVYGPFDNFDLESAMVIPSLIRKAYENEVLEVWGDGTQIRDFIHAKDVALGMIFAVENKISEPLNLGSGHGVSIKEIAEIISKFFAKFIVWKPTPTLGDPVRILDMSKTKNLGFETTVSIEKGLIETIEWYLENKNNIRNKYKILS